jgi:prephenate dehydratase
MTAQPQVSFIGLEGAYSHLACTEALPDLAPLPCPTFEEACAALADGRASRAMIPMENNRVGRVADIHQLLPEADLAIVGEHYQTIAHRLLAVPGARVEDLVAVHSHVQALAQCHHFLRRLGVTDVVEADTAGAAKIVADRGEPTHGAIASALAGKLFGLEVLAADIADSAANTTRFIVLSRDRVTPHPSDGPVITTILFKVRSVPAALYKALGGFATNGVNLTKLESYLLGDRFTVAQFYADLVGHPEDPAVQLALEELRFFSDWLQVLGTYPAHPFRGLHDDPA